MPRGRGKGRRASCDQRRAGRRPGLRRAGSPRTSKAGYTSAKCSPSARFRCAATARRRPPEPADPRATRPVRGQLHGGAHRQRAAALKAYLRHWGPRGRLAAPAAGGRAGPMPAAHAPAPAPPRRPGPRVRDPGALQTLYCPRSGSVCRYCVARGGRPRARVETASLTRPHPPPSHVDEWVEPLQRLCLQARDEDGVEGSVGADTSGAASPRFHRSPLARI